MGGKIQTESTVFLSRERNMSALEHSYLWNSRCPGGGFFDTHCMLFSVTTMNPFLVNLVTLLTKALVLKGDGVQILVKAAPTPSFYNLDDEKRSLGGQNSSHGTKGFGMHLQHRFIVPLMLLPLKLIPSLPHWAPQWGFKGWRRVQQEIVQKRRGHGMKDIWENSQGCKQNLGMLD